jgi:hypothetical protein
MKYLEYDAYEIQDRFAAMFGLFWAFDAAAVSYPRSDGMVVISEGDVKQICRDLVQTRKPGYSVEALYQKITEGLSPI